MKLSEVKSRLQHVGEVRFVLPDGAYVPRHFHVTEVGEVSKQFIDCGGVVRKEKIANFQLWQATDFEHRLAPNKMIDIIELSQNILHMDDLEVEVEYQAGTIGKFGLDFNGKDFVLTNTFTDCLAPDKCGIPVQKKKVQLAEIGSSSSDSNCTPGSGCC